MTTCVVPSSPTPVAAPGGVMPQRCAACCKTGRTRHDPCLCDGNTAADQYKRTHMTTPQPPHDSNSQARRKLMVGVASVAGTAGLGLAWWHNQPAAGATAQPADPGALAALWALRLERPEGGELVLDSLRGKPLLINFWATWCAPCVREMPEIDRFHTAFSPRGWHVLGLAVDSLNPVRAYLARVKVGFPIGLAGLDGTELVHTLGNPQGGLPFTVLIGANGQVLQRKLGETRYDELAGWAEKI